MASKNTKDQKKLNKSQYEKARVKSVKKERREDEEKVHLFSRGKNFDFGLLLVVLVLLTAGLIMILSASNAYSLRTEGDSYFYFKKQLVFAGIGLVLMFLISRFDYRMLNSRLSWFAYVGGLGLMALVLVPGIGVERNDAVRWINIAGLQFQPSEIMKVCFVLIIAYVICRRQEEVSKFWNGLVPVLCLSLPVLRIISNSRALKCNAYYFIYLIVYASSCWC